MGGSTARFLQEKLPLKDKLSSAPKRDSFLSLSLSSFLLTTPLLFKASFVVYHRTRSLVYVVAVVAAAAWLWLWLLLLLWLLILLLLYFWRHFSVFSVAMIRETRANNYSIF